MPRRGENIYKRKDGRWEGRYIKQYDINGKAQYGYVYGRTYSAVKKVLAEKLIKNNKPEKMRSASVYKDILVSWLESQRLNKKESTYARYYQIVHTHLIPDIGFIKIERMSTKLIEKYMAQLIESGRIDGAGGLSAKTVSDILAIIKATMAYAKCNDYSLQCNLDKLYIKQQNTEMRVLSIDEQQKLTLVLLEETDLTKFGILLSLYTGIRIGEVCALRWKNLSVVDGILSVKETMQRIKDTSSYPCRSAHSFAEINEISSFAVGGSSIQYARSSRLRPFCQMSLAARFNARETASLVRFPVRLRTSLQMKCIFGIFG